MNPQQNPYTENFETSPALNFNENNPPCVPANIQIPPWLNGYVPYICGVTACVIQNQRGLGKLSTMLFNIMAINGWQNNNFATLMQDVCDYIYIKNRQNPPAQQNDIINMINTDVNVFIMLKGANLLTEFQHLGQYIRPNDTQMMQQRVGDYVMIMNNINQMRQQTQQQMQQAQPQYGNNFPGNNMSYGNNNGMNYNNNNMPPARHQPFTSGNTFNTNSIHGMPGTNGSVVSSGRDYSTAAKVVEKPTQYQQYQQPIAKTIMTSEQTTPFTDVQWKKTDLLVYPFAFNPTTHKLHYKLTTDQDGKIIATNPIVKEELNMIDYDRHAVASMFGRPPANMHVQNNLTDITEPRIRLGIEIIEDDVTKARISANEGIIAPKVFTYENNLVDTSIDALFDKTQIHMMEIHNKKPVVFRAYGEVYTPLIGWADETEALKDFVGMATYEGVRNKLINDSGEMSPLLVSKINVRMTQLINDIMHVKLGIHPSELTMDDFVADFKDCQNLLTMNYGELAWDSLLKHQSEEIRSRFLSLNKDDGQDVIIDALSLDFNKESFEEGNSPQFTFIGTGYSFTIIDILSHDLQIQGVSGVGSMLTQEYHPVMLALAKNIISSSKHYDGSVAKYLVRTLDGRIFEISLGNIGTDVYLISLVK